MIKIFLFVIYTLCWIKLIRTNDCNSDDSTGYYESKLGNNVKTISMKQIDDESLTKFLLKSNLTYFDRIYRAVIINQHGFIKLAKSRKEIIRMSIYDEIKFPVKETLLFPFMSRILDTKEASNTEIVYRFVEDEKTQSQIKCDLIKFDPNINVNIEWSLIISWNNVLPSYIKVEKHKTSNTFQLCLVKCEKQTYLIYNYAQIKWANTNIKNSAYLGYVESDSNFHLITSQNNITDVLKKSNVGIPSKWIFRVDSKNPSERTTSDITSTNDNTLFTNFYSAQNIEDTESYVTTSISQTVANSRSAENTITYLSNGLTINTSINAETTNSIVDKHSESQTSSLASCCSSTVKNIEKTNFFTFISSTKFTKLFLNESTFSVKNLSTIMITTHNVTSKSVKKSTQNRSESYVTNSTYTTEIPGKNTAFISIRTLFIISAVCLLVGLVNLIVYFAVYSYKRRAFNSTRLKNNVKDSLKLKILNSEVE